MEVITKMTDKVEATDEATVPTTVTCKSCKATNVGDNVGNVYFSMAQLHKDGCNYNGNTGFTYQTQQGDYIINGELSRTGAIV